MEPKESKKLYTLLALVVVALGVAYFMFFRRGAKPQPAALPAAPATALPPDLTNMPAIPARFPTNTAPPPPALRRDIFAQVSTDAAIAASVVATDAITQAVSPVRSATAVKEESIKLRLTGIMRSRTGSMATIDGRVVSVGDRIGPYTVAQIAGDQVILTAGDRQVVLDRVTGANPERKPSAGAAPRGNGL
jgi:hypothetical protein